MKRKPYTVQKKKILLQSIAIEKMRNFINSQSNI